MSNRKEEIRLNNGIWLNDDSFEITDLYAAMDEYAKEVAIEFGVFIMENTCQDLNTDNKWVLDYPYREISNEEIWELFIQSKKQ